MAQMIRSYFASPLHVCLIVYSLLWFIFQLHVSEAGNAILVNNGFQNVTVAISSSIKQSSQASLISGLQTLFQTASSKMFTATGQRAYFATIIIRFPPTWDDDQLSLEASSSESESYYEADFRVANPNTAYGDLPYTQQSKGCGEPGDFIHLTPTFITNNYNIEQEYGPAENLLMNEWIKYRYGVFDENGYAFDYTYPQMYFSQNDTSEYNMCNTTDVTWSTRTCNYNGDIAGLPSNCVLEAYQSSSYNQAVTSSMLSRLTLPVAKTFCHNHTDHNQEAPNKHNFLCNGKSAMEVILEHEDFQDGRNSPADIYIPNPSIYQESQRVNSTFMAFFVWDPMTLDQTYYTAGPALLKFVYVDFPATCYFGIIDTVDTNEPFLPLTQVEESNRYDIYTDILSGLRTSETPVGNVYQTVEIAIQALQSNESVSGSNAKGIIVMSNTESETPWNEVCTKAESNNIRLILVTYNQVVADEFDNSSCVGRAIVIGGILMNDSTNKEEDLTEDLFNCLIYLEQRAKLDIAFLGLPAIISSGYAAPLVYHLGTYTNSTEDTFVVDSSRSNSSYFYVETCTNIQEHPPATLLTCWLGDADNVYPYDSTIQAFFVQNAMNKSGIWSFGISQITTRDIEAPYTVYAVGSSIPNSVSGANDTAIQIRAWVDTDVFYVESNNNDSYYLPKVRLFASVNRGTSPVFDARVLATITNNADSDEAQIFLVDNGSGNPDTTKNDGVYSSYFTQFFQFDAESVQYFVSIVMDDNDGLATYPVGRYPWLTGVKQMDVEYTQPFMQKEFTTFSYKITPDNADQLKQLPAGNIYDLRVVETQGATITLEWTAPGSDYDYGQAHRYIFKCSTDRYELINDFDELPDSEIPFVEPSTPKYTQSITFTGINDKETHFCAMKACDNNDCVAAVLSNVISYYIESR